MPLSTLWKHTAAQAGNNSAVACCDPQATSTTGTETSCGSFQGIVRPQQQQQEEEEEEEEE